FRSFHFLLKIALPIIASPNHVHRCPESQFALQKSGSLDSAVTAGLVGSPDKTVHLPQRLLLARLQEVHQAIEPFFVVANGAKRLAHFRGDLLQNNLCRLPGRSQFERMSTRIRHDQIDVFLQWNNLAFLFEASCSGRPRAREYRLTRGNSMNVGCGSEFLKGVILMMMAN